jgi:ABC-type Fe3+-hydroxamate transport system substrate-binding protein
VTVPARDGYDGGTYDDDRYDDLGVASAPPRPPRRIVSLVPSLSEAVAVTAPGLLVGATDYCTHPAGLDVPRVGGSKYPSVAAVLELTPDLVLANEEENRAEDVEALRAAGIPVWVTAPRTLAQAFTSLGRMLAACDLGRPQWWDEARRAWAPTFDGAPPRARALVPVWRRPWIALGRDTFAGDVLAHLGVANLLGGHGERYPRLPIEELRALGPDLVVLPDEPYPFTAADGPEAFGGVPAALVSGRHLTWYGPSLLEARDLLERQLYG